MSKLKRIFGRNSEEEQEEETPAEMEEVEAQMDMTTVTSADQGQPGGVYGIQFQFDNGEVKSFVKLPVMIGRDETNELHLVDDSVSSKHARVYFDERIGGICIEDQHSLNGVFVNDLPTSKNLLRDGDKVRFGNAALTFRDTGYIHSED
jgi:pSer/pThr/pTyr-binding forkhead associated (FHA) protein